MFGTELSSSPYKIEVAIDDEKNKAANIYSKEMVGKHENCEICIGSDRNCSSESKGQYGSNEDETDVLQKNSIRKMSRTKARQKESSIKKLNKEHVFYLTKKKPFIKANTNKNTKKRIKMMSNRRKIKSEKQKSIYSSYFTSNNKHPATYSASNKHSAVKLGKKDHKFNEKFLLFRSINRKKESTFKRKYKISKDNFLQSSSESHRRWDKNLTKNQGEELLNETLVNCFGSGSNTTLDLGSVAMSDPTIIHSINSPTTETYEIETSTQAPPPPPKEEPPGNESPKSRVKELINFYEHGKYNSAPEQCKVNKARKRDGHIGEPSKKGKEARTTSSGDNTRKGTGSVSIPINNGKKHKEDSRENEMGLNKESGTSRTQRRNNGSDGAESESPKSACCLCFAPFKKIIGKSKKARSKSREAISRPSVLARTVSPPEIEKHVVFPEKIGIAIEGYDRPNLGDDRDDLNDFDSGSKFVASPRPIIATEVTDNKYKNDKDEKHIKEWPNLSQSRESWHNHVVSGNRRINPVFNDNYIY